MLKPDQTRATRHVFLTKNRSTGCAKVVLAEEDAQDHRRLRLGRKYSEGWTLNEAARLGRLLQRIRETERENAESSVLQFDLESNGIEKE